MFYDIWTQKNAVAENIYSRDNYIIEDHAINSNSSTKSKKCVIYCSSNNIWSPNEEYAFRRSFLENDYYEWRKLRVNCVDREIWIRDIYKSWYVTGINSRINSIDKLIEFLRDVTKGYEIIIIGSSAGGYLAAILSKALTASKSIVFSAQFDLNYPQIIDNNPFLSKYKETSSVKYYDLSRYLLDTKSELFYIYPMNNKYDMHHYEKIKSIESNHIHCMGLKSKRHGMVVYKCCIAPLINLDTNELIKLFLRENQAHPFTMSFR